MERDIERRFFNRRRCRYRLRQIRRIFQRWAGSLMQRGILHIRAADLHDHRSSRGKNFVRLRAVQIEHDARNRRIRRKKSDAQVLHRSAIHCLATQLRAGSYIDEIDYEAIGIRYFVGLRNDAVAGFNLNFNFAAIAQHLHSPD